MRPGRASPTTRSQASIGLSILEEIARSFDFGPDQGEGTEHRLDVRAVGRQPLDELGVGLAEGRKGRSKVAPAVRGEAQETCPAVARMCRPLDEPRLDQGRQRRRQRSDRQAQVAGRARLRPRSIRMQVAEDGELLAVFDMPILRDGAMRQPAVNAQLLAELGERRNPSLRS